MPTYSCPCCQESRSQTNIVNHIMGHKNEILPVLQQDTNSFSTLRRGEGDPLYICFGCKKMFVSTENARRHYKQDLNCKLLHRRFLEDIGLEVNTGTINVRLQREVLDLRHQVERLTEDLLAENRMSKMKALEEDITYYKDYVLMIQSWLCPFIMERLTPDERKYLATFWRLEHNPFTVEKPRADTLKLLRDQLQGSPFLQMMAVPTFHDYKMYRQLGHHLTTTLISGMAFFNISFVPPAYGPLPSDTPPSDTPTETCTDDENSYYSDGD